MPRDLEYYRQNAIRCERLAHEAGENLRAVYLDIAAHWRKLADEIEADAKRQSQQNERKVGSGA